MTPREFANTLKGITDRKQFEQRAEWERTRWLGFITSQVFGNSKIQSPQDLFLLDHEQPNEKEQERRKKAVAQKFPKQI